VFITGGNRGIGKATAKSLAAAGASPIAIGSRRADATSSSAMAEIFAAARSASRPPPTVIQVLVDVSSQPTIDAAAAELSGLFDGRLDILVNNAGYMAPAPEAFADQPGAEYAKQLDVNLLGAVRVTKAFMPLLLAGSDRTIILLSSVGCQILGYGLGAYGIAKLALCRLAEYMLLEHGRDGVVAYPVHPGGVRTPLARGLPDEIYGELRFLSPPVLLNSEADG